MTLYEVIKYFKELALAQPNVNTAQDGSIYDIMNANPSQNYKAFVITQQNHREDEYDDIYSLTLFMVDRLVDNRESNRLMIQSLCKEQLSNIIRVFVDNIDIDFPDNINYVTFTQKFKDECAGAYAQLELSIPKSPCYDGEYPVYRSGEIKLEAKTVDITENGTITVLPTKGYDGMTKVTLNVNVPSGGDYQQGYEDGYAKGKEDQKGLLQELETVVNGTFETENGYSKVTVNVPTGEGDYEKGFQDGYAAGVADQKKKLESITIDANGTYEREDGYNKIIVNVPSDPEELQAKYDEGKADGIEEQKGKLETITIDANGTYEREDGYNKIIVNVEKDYQPFTLDVGIDAVLHKDELIGKAVVSVSDDETVEEVVYTGQTLMEFKLKPGKDYTVSYSSVNGFDAPEVVNFTSTWGGILVLSAKYIYTGKYTSNYLVFSSVGEQSIKRAGTLYDADAKNIEYSYDNTTWKDWEHNTEKSFGNDVKIYVRGVNSCLNKSVELAGFHFEFSNESPVTVAGNIMSLLDWTNDLRTIEEGYAFHGLFNNAKALVNAENLELPATKLAKNCYCCLFYDCTNLVNAPELPATELTEGCYYQMFYGCLSLVNAPALPATKLAKECYYGMFQGCSSLVNAPALPATELAKDCYLAMFQECSSLVNAPALPATELVEGCYLAMFRDCKNLNKIVCKAKENIEADNNLRNWLLGASATGDFYKYADATFPSGKSGIPSGWIIIELTD